MLGGKYFKIRKHLADIVLRVLQLAEKMGAEKQRLLDNDIIKELSHSFLFVVCRDVNAGKSTMLNGWFGENICKTNVLPESDLLQWYRYGEKNNDKKITPILEERFRPVDFLMDFSLVDTPGTNSVVRGHQAVTDRFLPVSDLIFWVFSSSNLWGASTWNLIADQGEEMLEKSIFILQQADLRDEKDIEIIVGHMRDLWTQHIGRNLPVYPVSGKLALEANQENPFSDCLWRESGYPALEKYISDVVANSPARRDILTKVRDAAGETLRGIEDMIELRTRHLEGNEGFLRGIEAEIDREREQQSSEFATKFAGMGDIFSSQGEEIKQLMHRKMSVWASLKSLFTAEDIPKTIEATLVDSVKTTVDQQASDDGKYLMEECRRYWEIVCPRVGECDEETGGFESTRDQFTRHMACAVLQAVVNLKIRGELDMQLAGRRAGIKTRLYVCLVLFLASGVTGTLKISPYPYPSLALLSGAVAMVLIFTFRSRHTRHEVIAAFAGRLDDALVSFADTLGNDCRDGMRDFYIEYGYLLGSVRSHIANIKLELKPKLEQWNSLFLELKEIEQEF